MDWCRLLFPVAASYLFLPFLYLSVYSSFLPVYAYLFRLCGRGYQETWSARGFTLLSAGFSGAIRGEDRATILFPESEILY